jgi:hypothetical protein
VSEPLVGARSAVRLREHVAIGDGLSAPRRPLASARRLLLDGAVLRDAERDAFDLVEACLPFAGDGKDGLHHRLVVVLLRRDEESLQEVQVLEEYSSCVGGPIVHTWPCASASAVKRIDKSVNAIARTGGDVKRWLREDPAPPGRVPARDAR